MMEQHKGSSIFDDRETSRQLGRLDAYALCAEQLLMMLEKESYLPSGEQPPELEELRRCALRLTEDLRSYRFTLGVLNQRLYQNLL